MCVEVQGILKSLTTRAAECRCSPACRKRWITILSWLPPFLLVILGEMISSFGRGQVARVCRIKGYIEIIGHQGRGKSVTDHLHAERDGTPLSHGKLHSCK